MKATKFWAVLVLGAGLALIGTSCTSDEKIAEADLSATVTDEALAAEINDEIFSEAEFYANGSANAGGKMAVKPIKNDTTPSVTCTTDSLNSTITFTIDFGTTGITGKRGSILKGKLIVTFNLKNASRTITFDNFYVNNNKVTGSKTVTHNVLAASWTISVNDTITRPDDSKIVWVSERTRKRVDNNGTPLNLLDDKFAITGSSHGINAKGKEYSMVIDPNNPLIAYNNFRYFVQGSVTITSASRTAVLDYGDGSRDNKATITINGKVTEITLK